MLKGRINKAGVLQVWFSCIVLPQLIYDALIVGSDNLQVDIAQWLGSAVLSPNIAGLPLVDIVRLDGDSTALQNLKSGALASVRFIAQAGSTNTILKTNLSHTINNTFIGRRCYPTDGVGNLLGQGSIIVGYDGVTN